MKTLWITHSSHIIRRKQLVIINLRQFGVNAMSIWCHCGVNGGGSGGTIEFLVLFHHHGTE